MKKIEDYETRLLILNATKYITGTVLGIMLGLLNVNPTDLFQKVFGILIIVGILLVITLVLRYVLFLQKEPLPKLLLLHGSIWYFLAVFAFWSLLINL